jgi:hypothetical protein
MDGQEQHVPFTFNRNSEDDYKVEEFSLNSQVSDLMLRILNITLMSALCTVYVFQTRYGRSVGGKSQLDKP